jgi:amino acid adenylation domain-containing protein
MAGGAGVVAGSQNAARLLQSAAGKYESRIALVKATSGASVTFSQLWVQALGVASRLRRWGLSPGDRVAILVERGASGAAAYFGVLASGGVAAIINETLRRRQVEFILSHAGAKILVVQGKLLERLGPPLPDVQTIDIEKGSAPEAGEGVVVPRVSGDMAHIIYTSGSTGRPKGVVVSHGNVWAGMQAVVDYLGITAEDRIASLLPFSFDYGLNQLLCAVGTGAILVVEKSPVPQRIVQSIVDNAVTVLPAVPPLWLQLLAAARFREEPLPLLRVMTNTGGRLPKEAVRALRRAQPQANLVLMYGLTEAFRSTYLPPHLVDAKPDSIGRAIPGCEMLVIRPDLTPCRTGEIGQLVHRGPTVALGYWNEPAATAARFGPNPLRPAGTPDAERVVFSGDLVRMDEDGDLFFVGRSDQMIKSMGYRVSPDEITEVLYASGQVVESIITTEADAMRGDAIIAHVVLKENGSLDRLRQHAASELPRYMHPVRYVFHASLARTTSGKHDLQAIAAAG